MLSTLLAATLLLGHRTSQPTGKMVMESVAATLVGSSELIRTSKLGFRPSVCFAGAYIEPGATVTMADRLEGGQTYLMTVAGNDGTKGVRVSFHDADGKELTAKEESEQTASVALKTGDAQTAIYAITNTGNKAEFFSMCVMTDGKGYELHPDNLNSVLSKLERLNKVLSEGALELAVQPDTWSIYGGVLAKGESLELGKLPLGSADYAVLGFGDLSAKSLTLGVSKDDGTSLGSDTSDQSAPLVELPANYGGSTSVALKNVDGDLSFSLFALLRKVK